MREESPLIRRPNRQGVRRLWLFRTLFAVGWTAWLALWLPLITAILWILGFHHVSKYLFNYEGELNFSFVALIAFWCGFVILGWASYNIWLFHGPDRRRSPVQISHETILQDTRLDETSRQIIASAQRMTVHFSAEGEPVRIEACEPLSTPPEK